MRRGALLGVGLVITATMTACGSATPSASSANPRAVEATLERAKPAGISPSKTAKMICAHEAREDLAGVLAEKPTTVTPPTWVDHLYSCNYVYPEGTVTLSVKELDDAAHTTTYFDGLASDLGRLPKRIQLAQGSFETPNGSIVVRKDNKVLLVDVTKLPAGFNRPALDAFDVSSAIAVTILGCWT
jgi:hypothetical protein